MPWLASPRLPYRDRDSISHGASLNPLTFHAIASTISVPWNSPFLPLFENVRLWYCYVHHRNTSFPTPSLFVTFNSEYFPLHLAENAGLKRINCVSVRLPHDACWIDWRVTLNNAATLPGLSPLPSPPPPSHASHSDSGLDLDSDSQSFPDHVGRANPRCQQHDRVALHDGGHCRTKRRGRRVCISSLIIGPPDESLSRLSVRASRCNEFRWRERYQGHQRAY
jgi:hypothetical protein